MSQYTAPDNPDKVKKKPCDGLRDNLKLCILESDCVRVHGRSPKDCITAKNDPSIPEYCQFLKINLFECKRSLMDMRRRFKGPKGY